MRELTVKQIKSVMLGHAVGDAIGVPVEFCSREELDANPVTDMMGFGSYPVPAGAWSDDTSIALATLDSLRNDKVDYDDIMKNFVRWCNEDMYTPTGQMFDIGRTCLTAIRNYLATDGKPALQCGLDDENSNGNGSLMRIHPVSLYLYSKGVTIENAIDIVHNVSSITHAHTRSQMACGIYTFVLWELLENPSIQSIFNGLRKARAFYAGHSEKEHFTRLFLNIGRAFNSSLEEMVFLPLERKRVKSSGYVIDTIEAATWCILTTDNYKDCILKAVNLGGDTDTVAAVAGGLAGALYGYDAIPSDWCETLIKRKEIESMCKSAALIWRDSIVE